MAPIETSEEGEPSQTLSIALSPQGHLPHVVGTNFGKGLGGGIFEFRLDQDAAQVLARKGKRARPEASETAKILLRLFCHAHGDRGLFPRERHDKIVKKL